jgi:hypothetical protein
MQFALWIQVPAASVPFAGQGPCQSKTWRNMGRLRMGPMLGRLALAIYE